MPQYNDVSRAYYTLEYDMYLVPLNLRLKVAEIPRASNSVGRTHVAAEVYHGARGIRNFDDTAPRR